MTLTPKSLLFLLLFLFFSLSLFPSGDSTPVIGVTYVQDSSPNVPRPEKVISYLRQSLPGITHIRLPNPEPDVIRSFSYSGISLLLSIPNSFIPQLASNRSNAIKWLSDHVIPYYPRAQITTISVGNEVLSSSPELSQYLLRAIRNVNRALYELGISKISVSTTHSFDIIAGPFPPSTAQFQESLTTILKPLLDFLYTTNSSFLVNIYPYHLYRSDPEIPISYVLFQDHQRFNFRQDPSTGLRYRNLFDVMVDAVISAMAALDQDGIPIVVAESGWPSDSDASEPEATELYAKMYNEGLVKHLRSSIGTPLERQGVSEAYFFELFDEELKRGTGSDRHWGILYPNMTYKYGNVFSGSDRGASKKLVLVFWLIFVVGLLQR